MSENFHFIGIGGIGMSGLARMLLDRNKQVSGSDLASSYVTDGLIRSGAKIQFGHSPQNITAPTTTVIYSSDIKEDNPELLTAKKLACPLWHRSDMLAHLMEGYQSLVVAGTHGKTTTTSLLICTLIEAGLDPSYAVGGIPQQLQTNANNGQGTYFVAEGDESDGTFLKYKPFGAIVTNIDFDHMNFYKTEQALIEAFKKFMQKVSSPEHLIWCGDDPRLKALGISGISYGFSQDCILRAENIRQIGWKAVFDVLYEGDRFINVELALTGQHNVLNALAVFGLALRIGIPEDKIRTAFKSFKGVKRRCEQKGEVKNVLVIDDYAHHPTELQATLKAIREAVGERRLIAVYQPHRYSRMKDCLGTFGDCFQAADEIILTDIFASGELPLPGVTTDKIFEELSAHHNHCQYVPRQYLGPKLTAFCRPHDVIVTLGAGDITKLGGELIEGFQQQPPRKLKVGLILSDPESIQAARFIQTNINQDLYQLRCFGVTLQKNWISGPRMDQFLQGKEEQLPTTEGGGMTHEVIQELQTCDIILPLYDTKGELQGFLDILGVPYIGCDHTSSALCSHPMLSRQSLLLQQVPVIPALDFDLFSWRTTRDKILEGIKQKMAYPCMVKPVGKKNSIRVEHESGLAAAIDTAFHWDSQVMIEREVTGKIVQFAVFGNDRITVFPPNENFHKEGMMKGARMCAEVYKALRCQGAVLMTCLMNEKQDFMFKEVSSYLPLHPKGGFVEICEFNKLKFKDLIDRLIVLAFHRQRRDKSFALK